MPAPGSASLTSGWDWASDASSTTSRLLQDRMPLIPTAILILQQLRPAPAVAQAAASAHGAGTAGNWYPINLYDTREGEMRDNNVPNVTNGTKTYSSCSVNGIMNAVELDIGNLHAGWKGTIGATGTNVNYTNFNGYVLYFSDHRGMLPSTHPSNGGQTLAGVINGESGLEDVDQLGGDP